MLVTFGICFKQHFDTRYLVFYNPSPPRMFLSLDVLWEYRIQHGALFNTDPFMSHLATQLRYSAGEFQVLQLIVLAAFGVVDEPLAPCMLVHLLEIEFKQQLGCRFDIMDNISYFLDTKFLALLGKP